MLVFNRGATQIETPVAHNLIAILYKVLQSAEHYLQSPGSGKPSHLADAGCLDIQSNVDPNQFIKKKNNKTRRPSSKQLPLSPHRAGLGHVRFYTTTPDCTQKLIKFLYPK